MAQEAGRRALHSAVALLAASILGASYVAAQHASAEHSPANKIIASASKLVQFEPGASVTLLTARLRTSRPTDLVLTIAAECAIFTGVDTAGTDAQFAQGAVRIWVEVDGAIVPIESASEPPQDPQSQPLGNESDKVTFCDRLNDRVTRDGNEDDFQSEFESDKAANSFQWIRLNTGSGVHQIDVKADLVTTSSERSVADAYVGNRVLVVEAGKMSNDAAISEGP